MNGETIQDSDRERAGLQLVHESTDAAADGGLGQLSEQVLGSGVAGHTAVHDASKQPGSAQTILSVHSSDDLTGEESLNGLAEFGLPPKSEASSLSST